MNLVHNERVKLVATFANNLAVGVTITGYISVLIRWLGAGRGTLPTKADIVVVAFAVPIAISLLTFASWYLTKLRE